jgi:hypothetical protein
MTLAPGSARPGRLPAVLRNHFMGDVISEADGFAVPSTELAARTSPSAASCALRVGLGVDVD